MLAQCGADAPCVSGSVRLLTRPNDADAVATAVLAAVDKGTAVTGVAKFLHTWRCRGRCAAP